MVPSTTGNQPMTNAEIAKIIYSQMGGSRLAVMTGAKNFVAIENGLQFDLPKKRGYVRDGINKVQIILDASDTYTMRALKMKKFDYDEIRSESGLYCDMIQNTFEQMTGLYTTL